VSKLPAANPSCTWSYTSDRHVREQKGKVSISNPACWENGVIFEIECDKFCECEGCWYGVEAYSTIFIESIDDEGLGRSTDSNFIPVHDACLQLFRRHLRGRLPASTPYTDKLCADALERLTKEYDDLPLCHGDTFTTWDEIRDLNGHYGAAQHFTWIVSNQIPPFVGQEGLVFDANCSNRVCRDVD
jgi:hypothetical protein